MKGESIPDDDHVARQCSKSHFVDTDNMTDLAPSVFEPIKGDPNISVNWVEHHNGDWDDRINAVCKDMSAELDVRSNHKLAVMQTGQIRSIGAERGHALDSIHNPLPRNESHSLLIGVPLDDAIIYQELADLASEHLVAAVRHKKQV